MCSGESFQLLCVVPQNNGGGFNHPFSPGTSSSRLCRKSSYRSLTKTVSGLSSTPERNTQSRVCVAIVAEEGGEFQGGDKEDRATTINHEKDRPDSHLEDDVRTWEELLADAQHRLRDQHQQSVQFEMQLLDRDTELANMWSSNEEEFQRQRAFQESELDDVRMQAVDLRAKTTQVQRDHHRDATQVQARIVEVNNKEAEYNKNEKRIKELEFER
ncbi:hypothetical protein HPB51_006904 [Rhipicephalus microplus]|uniref:Uncharacterized protein n=1 Tax=Rhipicephalus microplus TaxID=6941 RepID=A0A9J6D4D3_RHIMP|nr:hypothetical protein HPB51_006904 [Rhipicephalus microplus]